MSEASNLQVSIVSESHGRKSQIGRMLTLDLLKLWIKNLELDDYTANGLIQIASKYPQAAYPSFKRKINLMIQRVRAQRQKDQQGEEIESHEQKEPIPEVTTINEKQPVFDAGPRKFGITEDEIQNGNDEPSAS